MKPSKIIGSVAIPIARAFGMDCIDPETQQLRLDSGCAKRGERIDQWSESVYNYFVHPEKRKKNETMKYKVNMIIIVDSENTLAVTDQFKTLKGEITNFSVNPVIAPQPTNQAGVRTAVGTPPQVVPKMQ